MFTPPDRSAEGVTAGRRGCDAKCEREETTLDDRQLSETDREYAEKLERTQGLKRLEQGKWGVELGDWRSIDFVDSDTCVSLYKSNLQMLNSNHAR